MKQSDMEFILNEMSGFLNLSEDEGDDYWTTLSAVKEMIINNRKLQNRCAEYNRRIMLMEQQLRNELKNE